MKRITLFAIISLLSINLFADIDIDNFVFELENQDLTEEYYNIDDESAEGGMLTAFFHENSLQYFTVILYGETKRRFSNYYLMNNDLFYINIKTEYYRMPSIQEMNEGVIITGDIEKIQVECYVLKNEKIYSYNKTSSELFYLQNSELIDSYSELIDSYERYRNMIESGENK